MLTPREREALTAIAALETSEPEYEDWGGDTEAAEQYGMAAGLRFEAAELARSALARAPLAGAEVRAWRYEPGRGTEYIESLPLDRLGEWETGPNGYAVYVAESPGSPLQRHLADCATLADARAIAEAIALAGELAAYVLPGEPCPERCICESEDGEHDPGDDDLLDALTLFVDRARAAAR